MPICVFLSFPFFCSTQFQVNVVGWVRRGWERSQEKKMIRIHTFKKNSDIMKAKFKKTSRWYAHICKGKQTICQPYLHKQLTFQFLSYILFITLLLHPTFFSSIFLTLFHFFSPRTPPLSFSSLFNFFILSFNVFFLHSFSPLQQAGDGRKFWISCPTTYVLKQAMKQIWFMCKQQQNILKPLLISPHCPFTL